MNEVLSSQVSSNETVVTNTEITNKTDGKHESITENPEEITYPKLLDVEAIEEVNYSENKKHFGRLKRVIDSNSEDEQFNFLLNGDNTSVFVIQTHKKLPIINSDSESNNKNPTNEGSLQNSKPEGAKKLKRLPIFDSDSEEETNLEQLENSNNEIEDAVQEHKNIEANKTYIYTINKEGKFNPESTIDNDHYSRFTALCDPETSDEENETTSETDKYESVTKSVKQNKKPKLQSTTKTPKKMTGKEALEQKQEIHSESSRRARERQVSLPYHKPKSRTLKEFLQIRPRFADSLPKYTNQTRPSLAMKMSTKQLEKISKNLEEREKKLEEFFKSESESEHEQEESTINAKDGVENHILNEDVVEDLSNTNFTENNVCASVNENQIVTKLLSSDRTMNCNEKCKLQQSSTADLITTSEVNSEEKETNENEKSCTPEKENNEVLHFEKDTAINSEEFQFNLNSENCSNENSQSVDQTDLEQQKLNHLIAKYSDVEENKCIVDSDDANTENKVKSKLELLKDSLALYKPKLTRNPNHIIDLDEDVTKPNKITQLVERFIQHTMKKNHHKTKVHVNMISMVNGEICKQILSVPVDTDEMESAVISEKPGAKLRKLQEELQTQMAQRRSDLWKQKSRHQEEKNNVETDTDSKLKSAEDWNDKCKDGILDDEEEGEFTETESDVSDEELNEEDEKPCKKLAFADEEAEESERDEIDNELFNNEVEDINEAAKDNDDRKEATNGVEIENSEVADGDDESEDIQNEVKKKRKLKRIVQVFTDDSDDENDKNSAPFIQETIESAVIKKPQRKNKITIDDSTDTWDDSGPPPNQPRSIYTPRGGFSQTRSQLGFLTPVIHLTGLQNFNSGSKFLRDSPVTPFDLKVPTSPLQISQDLQKKLFYESANEENAQSRSECQIKKTETNTNEEIIDNTAPSTQDLLEICSGSFSLNVHPVKSNVTVNTPDFLENCLTQSTDACMLHSEINTHEASELHTQHKTSTGTEVSGDDDDRIISQLLDEEELEKFKQKFESPILGPSQTAAIVSLTKVGRFVFDSSDDEANDDTGQPKKMNNKKLVFSDEEEEDEQHNVLDQNILTNSDNENEMNVEDNAVEYDSEENEIEIDKEEYINKNYKLSDFVENEAELSETDWNSADEDENDMDELEFEQGDAEKFDENKVRMDLERIHMRRILDDDNRKVKILQELLLEDGELHGGGRQKQFKWKNIDSVNNDNEVVKEDISGVYDDERMDAENEEQWRKLRYQREFFLKKMQNESQENNDDEIPLTYESQVFKLGQAAVRRSISQNAAYSEQTSESTDIKQHRLLMVKRGSFLSRTDEVLTRLAEYSKVTTNVGVTVKNSRKFVFHSVAANEENEKDITIGKKRKPSEGTPNAIKKLRLSDLSPAVPSRNEKSNKVKKLFNSQ